MLAASLLAGLHAIAQMPSGPASLAAFTFPDLDPVLFEIGPFALRWYALAYIAGLVGGWLYARRLTARPALWPVTPAPAPLAIDDMLLWCAFGIVLGGRLGYVLFYNPGAYLANPAEIVQVWKGGMAFHGGLLGCAFAIVLFARSRGLVALSLFDIAACVAPIGLFFGRIANFINAELWGRPAPDLAWAVIFPNAGPVARHPSQLYEAGTEGLLLFVVMALLANRFGFRRPGLLAGLFAIGYALTRSFCEFFREPDAQLGYLAGGWLTMGILLSVPLALAGLALVWTALRNDASAPIPPTSPPTSTA